MEYAYIGDMPTTVIRIGQEPDPAKRLRTHQGEMIRKVRELQGLSPAELAAAVGVTPGAVSQWETGRYTPRQQVQVAIAHALSVPHSLLFNLDGLAA